jgi:hypothetical protein
VVNVQTTAGKTRIAGVFHGLLKAFRPIGGQRETSFYTTRRTVSGAQQLEAGQVDVGQGPEVYVHLVRINERLDQKHPKLLCLSNRKIALKRYYSLFP